MAGAMLKKSTVLCLVALGIAAATCRAAAAGFREAPQEPPAEGAAATDIPFEDLAALGDKAKRYFLIGPKKGAKEPAGGWRLMVVLPGGLGNDEFRPFVTNILRHGLSDDYLVAEPVSVNWTPGKEPSIVWPTRLSTVPGMKFGTEEFVAAVIEDVAKRRKIAKKSVFTLSWSSGGPAAYAISLQEKSPVAGSYIAMSVFRPKFLPPLSRAKGHAYAIDHSPDDEVCPFVMAEEARDALKKEGAKVAFTTYEGGHGWHGDVFGRIRTGVEFLEKNHAAAVKGK
jgi:predicted esterase